MVKGYSVASGANLSHRLLRTGNCDVFLGDFLWFWPNHLEQKGFLKIK